MGSLPAGAKQVLHVNSFSVDYRPDGSVQQFKSDLSVFDLDGRQKQKKTISVNQPIRCGLHACCALSSSEARLKTPCCCQACVPEPRTHCVHVHIYCLKPGQDSVDCKHAWIHCQVAKGAACVCRFDGVTAYQTDWSIAAVTLRAQGSPLQPDGAQPFNLPMASLEGQPGDASWLDSCPLTCPSPCLLYHPWFPFGASQVTPCSQAANTTGLHVQHLDAS